MRGQTAVEYLMTYGWAILIILIVAGVLAYYGIFAPAGFLGPTARGFGQVQVLNPWSLSAANGAMTLNIENRVGGTINVTNISYTLETGGTGTYFADTGTGTLTCSSGCLNATERTVATGTQVVINAIPATGSQPSGLNPGNSYTATVTIEYGYGGALFSSTGTLSGTFS